MIKSIILCSIFVLILAFFGKTLIGLGVFRHIETKGLDKCRLIIPTNGDGEAFEDLTIDYEKGLAYMAGDNRSWFHKFDLSNENIRKQGKIFQFDINSEKFQQIHFIDYPYEHFHPLGISLLKRKHHNQLFMTNFRQNNDGHVLGSVEIFQMDSSNKNQLKWIESVVHPLFTVPDDVLPIDKKTFYVTNVFHYPADKSFLLHNFEVFFQRPWTNLLLCKKKDQWKCSIIVDSIILANGVVASLDMKTIYVAASIEKRIRVYERNPETNSLTFLRSLAVPFAVDNILVNEYDQLIAAGHPNAIKFLLHNRDHRIHRSPSEVVLFPQPKTNSTFQHLLLTNGEFLSASTVGGTYKQNLLVGALCDPGILFCKDSFLTD